MPSVPEVRTVLRVVRIRIRFDFNMSSYSNGTYTYHLINFLYAILNLDNDCETMFPFRSCPVSIVQTLFGFIPVSFY